MSGEHERAKNIGIAAALCLALLGIVAWIVLHARPAGSVVARAAASSSREVAPSAAPELAAPQVVQRGHRVSETAPPEPAAVAQAEAGSPTEDDEDADAQPKTNIITLVGDISGRPGEVLGGPNTFVQLRASTKPRTVPIVRGSFRIEDNEPGVYELTCSAPGYRTETRTISLAASETEHREDFVLAPVWTVAIRLVTDDGRNLLDPDLKLLVPKGVWVDVHASPTPAPETWWQHPDDLRKARRSCRYIPRAREDEPIPGDPEGECSGRLEIYERPPVYVSADVCEIVLASTRLDTEVTTATLTVPLQGLKGIACALRCRIVVAESGEPISGDPVVVSLHRRWGGSWNLQPDENGIVERKDLLPGPCTLTVWAEGLGEVTREFVLLPSIENDLGTIALERERKISGRFVVPGGQAVGLQTRLVAYPADRPLELLNAGMYFSVECGADGRFESGGLVPIKYVLFSEYLAQQDVDWWGAPVLVDLTHGSVEDLVVPVDRPTTVKLHPAAEDVREEEWWVLASNGIVCAHGGFDPRRDTTLTLGPGNFRLLVGEDEEHVREIPFAVGNSPVTIPIEP